MTVVSGADSSTIDVVGFGFDGYFVVDDIYGSSFATNGVYFFDEGLTGGISNFFTEIQAGGDTDIRGWDMFYDSGIVSMTPQQSIDISVTGYASVAAVPVPASSLLLFGGLMLLRGVGRKKALAPA